MVEYNENQKNIMNYLLNKVQAGSRYFKSKYVGKDLGLSAKEVGTNLNLIATSDNPYLRIVKHSFSNSTTWRVEALTTKKCI